MINEDFWELPSGINFVGEMSANDVITEDQIIELCDVARREIYEEENGKRMKYYISDLHLGHQNILKFDNRPFASLDEMHQTIINNWNNIITDNDEVYILGDFSWKNQLGYEIAKQLRGIKYLIVGNHDHINRDIESCFYWVKPYAEIKDGESNIVLCHYPIAHWKSADHGAILLYGHIHMGRDAEDFNEYIKLRRSKGYTYECYNVGCMMPYMGYTPRTLEQIRSAANEYLRGDRMRQNVDI